MGVMSAFGACDFCFFSASLGEAALSCMHLKRMDRRYLMFSCDRVWPISLNLISSPEAFLFFAGVVVGDSFFLRMARTGDFSRFGPSTRWRYVLNRSMKCVCFAVSNCL